MNKSITALLFLFSAIFCAGQTYHIGDLYTAPDGSQGIVFWLHPDGSGGWVVALDDATTGKVPWAGSNADIPTLNNINSSDFVAVLNDTSGYYNTKIIRDAQSNNPNYAAGSVDFDNGWYLPSSGQLKILFSYLPFIAESLETHGSMMHDDDYYWSSTENFAMEMSTGVFIGRMKTNPDNVRAVRSFTVNNIKYDSTLTYLWSTGDTVPHVGVAPSQTTQYTVTATSPMGCQNTASKTVIVTSVEPQTIHDTVCAGTAYNDNGFSFSEDETANPTTLTSSRTVQTGGCEGTVNIVLAVVSGSQTTIDTVICQENLPYVLNGQSFYTTDEYMQRFTSASGCDSVVTLHLEVAETPQVEILAQPDTVCEGDNVELNVATVASTRSQRRVSVGDILCTDGTVVSACEWPCGKTAKGIVFHVDNTGLHGWAAGLEQLHCKWADDNDTCKDVLPLKNHETARSAINDTDGHKNTLYIRQSGNYASQPAAHAADCSEGWYIPSAGQLRTFFSEIHTINSSLRAIGKKTITESSYPINTSTECSAEYNYVIDKDGSVKMMKKSLVNNVVFILNF